MMLLFVSKYNPVGGIILPLKTTFKSEVKERLKVNTAFIIR